MNKKLLFLMLLSLSFSPVLAQTKNFYRTSMECITLKNHIINGEYAWSGDSSVATFDLYINGEKVRDDETDTCSDWTVGTSYEIKDLRIKDKSYKYLGTAVPDGKPMGQKGIVDKTPFSLYLIYSNQKSNINLNLDGGTMPSGNTTVQKYTGETFGFLSGNRKKMNSANDSELLREYANYEFGSKITVSTKVNFDNFNHTQEWINNFEAAGFGLGYNIERDSIFIEVFTKDDVWYQSYEIKRTINDNEDHWITGTYDTAKGEASIYIDGIKQQGEYKKLEDANGTKGDIKPSPLGIALGANPGDGGNGYDFPAFSELFEGTFYKAGIWKRILSEQEIKDMVNNDYIKSDALINVDYVPVKEGYTFLGWKDENENKIEPNTLVRGNTTLTAIWRHDYNKYEADCIVDENGNIVEPNTTIQSNSNYKIERKTFKISPNEKDKFLCIGVKR